MATSHHLEGENRTHSPVRNYRAAEEHPEKESQVETAPVDRTEAGRALIGARQAAASCTEHLDRTPRPNSEAASRRAFPPAACHEEVKATELSPSRNPRSRAEVRRVRQ